MALTIGQACRTVRDRRRSVFTAGGLLAQPARPESGFRKYPTDAARRSFHPPVEGARVFAPGDQGTALPARGIGGDLRRGEGRAEAKIADIEQRIRHLLETKRALVRLTVACREKRPTSECPILEALEGGLNSCRKRIGGKENAGRKS
jgi:MerR family mercuric resistance operon transcriptional regulator